MKSEHWKMLHEALDLNQLKNRFLENIEIATVEARDYHLSSQIKRSEDSFHVQSGNTNPNFNTTKLLQELCMNTLFIISTKTASILTDKDFETSKLFIKNRVEHIRSEQESGIFPAYGGTSYSGIEISFSNDKLRNIASISHELGHFILLLRNPGDHIKPLFSKPKLPLDYLDNLAEWINKNPEEANQAVNIDHKQIEELIADFFTLGIFSACEIRECESLILIFEDESRTEPHKTPRSELIKALRSFKVNKIDWFEIDWLEKASEAINNFYSFPVTTFEEFFYNLLGSYLSDRP